MSFKCHSCEKFFFQIKSLTKHEKIHERDPQKYPKCDKTLVNKISLKDHMR